MSYSPILVAFVADVICRYKPTGLKVLKLTAELVKCPVAEFGIATTAPSVQLLLATTSPLTGSIRLNERDDSFMKSVNGGVSSALIASLPFDTPTISNVPLSVRFVASKIVIVLPTYVESNDTLALLKVPFICVVRSRFR